MGLLVKKHFVTQRRIRGNTDNCTMGENRGASVVADLNTSDLRPCPAGCAGSMGICTSPEIFAAMEHMVKVTKDASVDPRAAKREWYMFAVRAVRIVRKQHGDAAAALAAMGFLLPADGGVD